MENEEVLGEEIQKEFEAGYAQVTGIPQENVESEVESEVDAEVKSEAEQPTIEEEEVAGIPVSKMKELLAKASEFDSLKADLEKTRSTLYGRFGELQRTIKELKARPSGAPNLNGASLKRLSSEYPELAELLQQDLSELSTGGDDVVSKITPIVEDRINSVRENIEQKNELRILDILQPNWRDLAKSPDFAIWKSGLEDDVRKEIETTWDASFLATGFNEFQKWMNSKQDRASTRKARLEQAVQPSNVPSKTGAPDEMDAFIAGFNAVRGVKL